VSEKKAPGAKEERQAKRAEKVALKKDKPAKVKKEKGERKKKKGDDDDDD
jgi:hypothetical protein